MSYSGMDAEGSPIDGSNRGGEQEDQLKPLDSHLGAGGLSGPHPGSTINVLGKPIGTNNFVTKLYQCVISIPTCLQHCKQRPCPTTE